MLSIKNDSKATWKVTAFSIVFFFKGKEVAWISEGCLVTIGIGNWNFCYVTVHV